MLWCGIVVTCLHCFATSELAGPTCQLQHCITVCTLFGPLAILYVLLWYCAPCEALKGTSGDLRSADQRQPRETMEQHLLAYLTTKYGVRQLITQWLTSILAAIEHFSPLDAQTALFGKVLRNEVEEEFEEAQRRVHLTAHSLLQSILQVIIRALSSAYTRGMVIICSFSIVDSCLLPCPSLSICIWNVHDSSACRAYF